MFETPHLIQRCELRDGKLEYDIMGRSAFEVGGQTNALRSILRHGIDHSQLTVEVAGKRVVVYMVSGEGYAFHLYRPNLQRLTERGVAGEELTDFDEAVKEKAGVEFERTYPDVNVWFDFPNEVLWTLTEENQSELIRVLEDIKTQWAAKPQSA